MRRNRVFFLILSIGVLFCAAHAATSKEAQQSLNQLLLGKDVKSKLDMPAYKDGLDIEFVVKPGKDTDDRGIDMKNLAKYLKDKGVGVERDEEVTITSVKVDSDRIELHLGGGGEGRGASKKAAKKGAGYKRAGGTRINFRYGRDVTDADLQPDAFLPFAARILDVSAVQHKLTVKEMPDDMQQAIAKKQIVDDMTYQMVLLSSGEPDQKKIDDSSSDESLHETWYYMKEGHRIVVKFENGKVVNVQTF
ncbi:MAG: hypothetical protein ABSD20_03440 [Terriglobales bacterium]|jgi:hypothetical protein